jgi:GNAT superfamily N-acetyltransferase
MALSRKRMRRALLESDSTRAVPDARKVTAEDGVSLGRLMYDAYLGSVDYDGETIEDAVAEVRDTIEGKYGEFDFGVSWLIEHDPGAPLSACLVVAQTGAVPLIAFCMTTPARQRHGLCTSLMRLAMDGLRQRGVPACELVVTNANLPAVSLYQKLGFHDVPKPGPDA